MPTPESGDVVDLLVVGGGINGCGIARDAAGRGLSVVLCEMADLAGATSSASTKLFHGGLRYLEHYEFRLVRELLIERETLWRNMPHISWPMRFVLPHHKGLRPFWLIRLGLFVYDHLGGRRYLPPTRTINLRRDFLGEPLQPSFKRGFEYSDCWVDDSRLVILNARDAADRGAHILTRTRLETARREAGHWRADLRDVDTGAVRTMRARALVNAAGPWVGEMAANRLQMQHPPRLRLVRGAHIVTKRLFPHDRCYVFQTADGRIVFAIPYEQDFTLIGTTDSDHTDDLSTIYCTDAEARYLCSVASTYLRRPVEESDIVRSFAGVRPLVDDGSGPSAQATRDYTLQLEADGDAAPLLNVLGGKITTYRRLAEAALRKLQPHLQEMSAPWTASAPLPGGDFPPEEQEAREAELQHRYPFLDDVWAGRLWRAYGTLAPNVLGDATQKAGLGRDFGWTLTEREVRWLVKQEWARTTEDILWRRSKLGLRLSSQQAEALADWLLVEATG